jgi:hypothetical protein
MQWKRTDNASASRMRRATNFEGKKEMDVLAVQAAVLSAAGYSLLYLLLGGGFAGAALIFVVAKLLGK